MNAIKSLLTIAIVALIAGCGGGGEEVESDFVLWDWDDQGVALESWQPQTTTQSSGSQSSTLYIFPFSLHQRSTLSSYVSRVGTTRTINYSVAGRMTTPTVANGTYSGRLTQTITYKPSALFEGLSVTPADVSNRYFNITLNGAAQSEYTTYSTSYFDTTYGFRIGSQATGTYKVLDPNNSVQSLPLLVVTGDTGDLFAYRVYSDSTKKTLIGYDIYGYKVLSVAPYAANEFIARVDFVRRSYSASGVLIALQTETQDLSYNSAYGGRTKTVSVVLDDIAGTTTSRLTLTRL